MHLLKRICLAVSIVSVASVSLAAVAIAAGGGLSPGDYVFNNTFARASFTTADGGKGAPGFDVTVNRGLNSFQPEDGEGSPTVSKGTMLNLFEFSPATGGAGGCFVIKPADFTVSRNVQTAALHATLTAADACPGPGAPVGAKGLSAPPPGGNGGGLVFPVKIDVTWTGLGVTANSRDLSTFSCADYSTRSTNISRTAGATASGSVSGLAGTFTGSFASVGSTDTHLEINGAPVPACFGK